MKAKTTAVKSKFFASVLTIAILTFASLHFISSLLADEDVSIYFDPSSLIAPPDSSVNVVLDTGVNEVGFVALTINFDETVVNITDPMTVTTDFGNVIDISTLDEANAAGSIRVVAAPTTDQRDSPPSGVINFMTIDFAPVTEDENVISDFSILADEVQIVSIAETNLTFNSTPGVLTINPAEATPEPSPSATPVPTSTPVPGTATLELLGADTAILNEPHVVELNLNTQTAVAGVDAVINFDNSLFTVDSVVSGELLGTDTFTQIDNENGIIRISQVSPQGASFTGQGVVAIINTTPTVLGNAHMSFDFTEGAVNESNVIEASSGNDTLIVPAAYQFEITDHVYADVSLLTESDNVSLGHTTDATLSIADIAYEELIQTDSQGQTFGLVLPDSLVGLAVNTTIKVEGYLSKTMQINYLPGTNIIDFGLLSAGDLNDDGIVNTLDVALMYAAWFGNGVADYNKDSVINSFDYWILIQNFFETN